MTTYRVFLSTDATAIITVEADSPEDAAELAGEDTPYLCAQCGGWGSGPSLELGDGWEVTEIEVAGDGDDD